MPSVADIIKDGLTFGPSRRGAKVINDRIVKDEKRVRLSHIARQGGCWQGENLRISVAVAQAESGGILDAVSYIGCCVGLWQVHEQHAGKHPPGSPSDKGEYRKWLQNPYNNARAACSVYQEAGGWGPWEAFTNGAYRKYLGKDPWIKTDKRTLTGAVGDAAEAVTEPLDAIANLVEALFSPQTYFRLGKGVLGVSLVIMGTGIMLVIAVNTMTKGEAGKAAKTAAKVAVTKGKVK